MQTAETLNIDLSRTFIFHHGFRLFFGQISLIIFQCFYFRADSFKIVNYDLMRRSKQQGFYGDKKKDILAI